MGRNAIGIRSFGLMAVVCVATLTAGQSETPSLQTAEAACKVQPPIENWDSTAQLIAGISNIGYKSSFTPEQSTAWEEYSKTAARDWQRLKFRYVDRIASWRTKNLNQTGDAVFYPFSGPDVTNPMAFFPDAREYTLVGLEPVGCVPASVSDYPPGYWPALRKGWQSAVALGFFKTDEMRQDLGSGSATGVLPVLLFLLARTGNTIIDVQPIAITATGTTVPRSDAVKTETDGVAIQFRAQRDVHGSSRSFSRPTVRTLRYFTLNLTNTRLKRKPGTTRYLNQLPLNVTLVKSASYLMHKRYFSEIRGLILSKSSTIIEDDSGIPYHYFEPAAWDVHLFGTYDKPIDLFKRWTQDDLKAAYDAKQNVQPLDFGISYRFRIGESNLLLARRKK